MAWGFHLLWKVTISPSAVAAIREGRVQGRVGLTSPLCGSFSFGNWCRDMVGISNGGVRVTREATQSEQLQLWARLCRTYRMRQARPSRIYPLTRNHLL